MQRLRAALSRLSSLLVVVVIFGGIAWYLVVARPGATVPDDENPGATGPLATLAAAEPSPPATSSNDASVGPSASAPGSGSPTGSAIPSTPAPPATSRAPETTPAPAGTVTPVPTRTPPPLPDPAPEGTPIITTARGAFGDARTIEGVRVTAIAIEPDPGLANLCATDDPERQGWTELVAYRITITWPDPGDAQEPWVAVGTRPWNVLSWEPAVTSGVPTTLTTCHRPGDSGTIMVELSPSGSPIIYYRWYFS